ncbi:MAG: hypothetical protein DWQ04_00975 [Chloroflexi bacterium]|nr:MAG: hypothetical protein DWQ04_00975 [Chloroflexota bacterium]
MLTNTAVFPKITTNQLPIFRQDYGAYTLFYAPGYLAIVLPEQVEQFSHAPASSRHELTSITTQLFNHARAAQETWTAVSSQPFTPYCLTLYLHNECNLRCTYCFAEPSPQPALRLSQPAITAAAKLVLATCQAHDRPFTLVCHGGGEPTLHHALLQQALQTVSDMAAARQVPLFRYIATNGVISSQTARWLAQNFDMIGLSCDGPSDVQNKQRPLWSNGNSSEQVERTAHILHEEGTPFDVRVTITNHTWQQQAEIAAYICQVLQPNEIHVEPVYHSGRAKSHRSMMDANLFVAAFLKAEQVAQQHGIPWRMSGSRPDQIHGPYCHLFRHVLNLVPEGIATACFKTSWPENVQQVGVQIGELDEKNGRFILHQNQIEKLTTKLHPIPESCRNCFNQYHCVRHCPDHCPMETTDSPINSFRCRVNRQLMLTRLQETAVSLWHKARSSNGVVGQKITNEFVGVHTKEVEN